jgi:DNA primase
MENKWVDFKQIKDAISMERVLTHYGVELRKVNAAYLRGKCPLPTHKASVDSKKESFGVNTQKKAWACQSDSCVAARAGRRGGNILDFVAAMESCTVRDAALLLQSWFLADGKGNEQEKKADAPTAQSENKLVAKKERSESDKEDINKEFNKPLEFALRGIDTLHPYLSERGIEKETAEMFGVGFFTGKGSMSNRVVFPIHNQAGKLVAYAGRALGGSEPEYKFPNGFKKSVELFNLHRALATDQKRVVIVEGFFDCLKVHQAGIPCVVGLMGSSLSDSQKQLLLDNFEEIVLMLDGDPAGRIAMFEIAAHICNLVRVWTVILDPGQEPDSLSSEQIRAKIGQAFQ